MSAFGYSGAIKTAAKDLKKKCSVSMNWSGYTVYPKTMEIFTSHMPDSEYSHLIAYKKDCMYVRDGKEHIKFFAFLQLSDEENENWTDINTMSNNDNYPEKLIDIVFDKLYKMSPAPILKNWIPYIMSNFIYSGELREVSVIKSENEKHTKCLVFDASVDDVVSRIQRGLRSERITIGDHGSTSPFMSEVEGIDAYLNEFSEVLTRKIQSSFTPMFTPGVDKYDVDLNSVADYMRYKDGIKLYPAQKDVAQSINNAFNKKKCAFIIGECGSGKTAMAIAAITVHFGEMKRDVATDYMTNIIMCPGHLVNTWKREIENRAPRSQAIIVKDFNHLLSLMPLLSGEKKRHNHIWLVISKEIAKFGYELRPGAVWREHRRIPGTLTKEHGVFCCPECGQPLYYTTKEGRGRYNRREIKHYLKETDFRSESVKKNNLTCENTVKVWNKKSHEWEWKTCGCRLWVPSTKETIWDKDEGREDRWLKLGKVGWIQKQHVQRIYDNIVSKSNLTNDEATLLSALNDEINREGALQRTPRKYPIAKYIRQYLRGKIDYFIADECHELKGKDSLQGESFGDMVYTAKRSLALTGTLLNGYASGIYYILFRMFSKQMKKEDYDFGNSTEFSREYGVTTQSRWYEINRNGRQGDSAGSSTVKELPGISPIVFTKFLLENAAFISLEDIAEALPGYEEIPVPLDMPLELRSAYQNLERAVHQGLRMANKSSKVLSQMIQLLSVYPDQPYEQPSVYDPENGNVLVVPQELSGEYREKENALLDIVTRKVAEGEKVLVYYTWTHRTDVAVRVPHYLEDHGFNVAVMDNSVKPADRESWIQKKLDSGVQVLFCNPKLVETGLTLLDFTTIVYYQMGYNLYTMRQASRRSWRINQTHDVQVYFLYYRGTVQEQALSLMATKLQAAMAIEGKFSEEGLNAMSNNEDILTQIASSVTEGIKNTVDVQVFEKNKITNHKEIVAEQKSTYKEKNFIAPYDLTSTVKIKSRKKKSVNDYGLSVDTPETMDVLKKLTGF
jgi:hypothetical protein